MPVSSPKPIIYLMYANNHFLWLLLHASAIPSWFGGKRSWLGFFRCLVLVCSSVSCIAIYCADLMLLVNILKLFVLHRPNCFQIVMRALNQLSMFYMCADDPDQALVSCHLEVYEQYGINLMSCQELE